jgi:uncharacterized protein YbbK (DUF523 family)
VTLKTIKIAISACLLGEKVRYDGKDKCHEPIIKYLKDNQQLTQQLTIEWIPFCPEVGIGLSVPRDKIQLEKAAEQIHVVGVLDHTWDVTEELKSFAANFIQKHADIDCYIVKSKSPSCGYQSTPLFLRVQGKNQFLTLTSGMFTRTILAIKPQLCIIEETKLDNESDCRKFLQKLID